MTKYGVVQWRNARRDDHVSKVMRACVFSQFCRAGHLELIFSMKRPRARQCRACHLELIFHEIKYLEIMPFIF